MKRQTNNLKSMGTELSITYTQLQILQRMSYPLKNQAIGQSKKVRLKDLKSSAQWEATHCGSSHFKPSFILSGFVEGSSFYFILILLFTCYLILLFWISEPLFLLPFYVFIFNFLGLVLFIFKFFEGNMCDKWIPY